jgi:hypothetical protein
MVVVRVGKPGTTTRKAREAASQLRPETLDVVAAKLIDCYEDYERRLSL